MQLLMVRFAQLLTMAAAALCAFGGVMILNPPPNAQPPHPNDTPLSGSIFLVLGFVFAALIWYYCQVYISRVEIDDDKRRLRLTLAGFIFPHRLEFGFDDVKSVTYHEGYSRTGGTTVYAPWEKVRIRGSRRSYILDVHGDYLDDDAVHEHLLQYRDRYPHWRPAAERPIID